MALDPRWIDRIFLKLGLVYGQRFLTQWGGMQPEDVKADWGHELEGTTAEGINHALHNLPPEHPPNVLQFRALCARRPNGVPDSLRLQAPVQSRPKELTRRLQALQAAMKQTPENGRLDWAYRLLQKQAQGEQLSRAQQDALNAVRLRLGGVPDDGNDTTDPDTGQACSGDSQPEVSEP